MTKRSLNDFSSSLNLSVTPYDLLDQYLNQAHALAHVALLENFSSSKQSIVHDYLSVLEDLILKARGALDELWRHVERKE